MCTVTIDIMDIDHCFKVCIKHNCAMISAVNLGNQIEAVFVGSFHSLFFLRQEIADFGGIASYNDKLAEWDDIMPISIMNKPVVK